jgi:hypothetical protein
MQIPDMIKGTVLGGMGCSSGQWDTKEVQSFRKPLSEAIPEVNHEDEDETSKYY